MVLGGINKRCNIKCYTNKEKRITPPPTNYDHLVACLQLFDRFPYPLSVYKWLLGGKPVDGNNWKYIKNNPDKIKVFKNTLEPLGEFKEALLAA